MTDDGADAVFVDPLDTKTSHRLSTEMRRTMKCCPNAFSSYIMKACVVEIPSCRSG